MLASDQDIRWMLRTGRIKVTPEPTDDLVQPASLDVHLDRFFRVINDEIDVIDPAIEQPDMTKLVEVQDGESFTLAPLSFALGSTLETIELKNDLAAELDGRSSVGRLGLLIHATAGWIDPGFRGTVTLEMFNLSSKPIKLYPGMRIAQLVFSGLGTPSSQPYGTDDRDSSYQDQPRGPVPSAVARTWNPVSTHLEGSEQ